MAKAIPLLARTAGLLAHLVEEQAAARSASPMAARRRGGGRVRARGRSDARARDRGPAVGRAAGDRRRAPTATSSPTSTSARPSTARSWPRRGSRRPAAAGGLGGHRAAAADREGASSRPPHAPDNPIGAHLCAEQRRGQLRIFSTSGTTGTPSYIPLTSEQSRQTGGQHRRAAARPPSIAVAGERIVSTFSAGPVRRRHSTEHV